MAPNNAQSPVPVAPGRGRLASIAKGQETAIVRTRRGGFLRNMPPKAKVGGAVLLLFVLLSIFGPLVAPHTLAINPASHGTPLAPTANHLFGTDTFGRDILTEWLKSLRGTVELGLLTATMASILTVGVGVTAGFLGGVSDEGLSLLMNIFIVLPALPLLIIVLTFLPSSGVLTIALVLALLGWSWGARVIRAQTLTLRGRDFVAAARENGERTWRLVVFEVLPNEVSLIAANYVGTFLYAILTSVALAFIGVTPISTWSLGTMLYWAQNANAYIIGAWWMYVPAGIGVALLGTSLVLINFGLDELGNPRLREPTGGKKRGGGRRRGAWKPTDPTPVELATPAAAMGAAP
jgi:peptide/nickel transport system permease protein